MPLIQRRACGARTLRLKASRSRAVLIALLIAALAGCEKAAPSRRADSPAAQRTAAAQWRPASAAEAKRFGRELCDKIRTGDAAGLATAIDWDVLVQTATADVPGANGEARRTFAKQIKTAAAAPDGAPERIINEARGGTVKVLRVRETGGQRCVLVRVTHHQGALGYYEFVVGSRPDGPLRVLDLYVFDAGEMLSQSLRRRFQGFLAARDKPDGDEAQTAEGLARISQLLARGEYRKALAQCDLLPLAAQDDKSLLLTRLTAASHVDRELLRDCCAAYRERFPNDPAPELIWINAHLTRDGAESRTCIERLDKLVGGDPYLDVARGLTWIEDRDLAAAKRHFERALRREPLIDAQWGLVTVALRQKDFATVGPLLTALEEKLDVRLGDLRANPQYAEYLKSPEYEKWRSGRK